MDLYDAASKITTLVALQQFVSAFDPTYCCPKPTKVKFHRAATGSPRPLTFSDVESHEVLFRVHDKSLSLHKERTVLDGRNGVPVATLRTALLHRTPTYEAFARTETEDTPETFQFSIESGRKVRIDFHDLVGGQRECVGCDPVAVEGESGASALEFWLVRGKDDVRQAIARVHYGTDGEGVLEVAKGVDLMMMVLVCIGLESHKEKTASP